MIHPRYGGFIVGTVKAMGQLEPYGNGTVVRGVKLDLKLDYPEGREFTWHSFCSTTKYV